jgi:hypothetical protein
MTSAQNARSLATANKKMDLSRQTEHEIAAPLSPDGPHHAPGRRRADPTTVRIEASVGVQTSRFFEDGQSRHVGLDNFGLLIEASCGLASLATKRSALPPNAWWPLAGLACPSWRSRPQARALSQSPASGLRAVAAVSRWMLVASGNSPNAPAAASRVSAKSGESWRLAGAVTNPTGMPQASTAIERLVPRLPRSTGLLPAFSPPPSMPW